VTTRQLCPTLSTCPYGYLKCSESKCINPLTETCGSTDQPLCPSNKPTYCRDSNTCIAGTYSQCSTIVTCPYDRPVKCASDLSCRKSIELCPIFDTQQVLRQGPAVKIDNVRCTDDAPTKCEDGTCSSQKCKELRLASDYLNRTLCLEDRNKYYCQTTKKCVESLNAECPAMRNRL
jgi:hypothetical protein